MATVSDGCQLTGRQDPPACNPDDPSGLVTPHNLMFSRFFSKRLDFVIAFCITGVSMKTMDTELTRKQQEKQQQTSDHRIACSDDHAGSIVPHKRARASDLQGAQFGSFLIGRFWPAAVGAARTEGASQSKWARKTRTWIANLQTTVVASIRALEPDAEDTSIMPWAPDGAVGSKSVLRLHGRRRRQGPQGRSWPLSCPGWAAASTAPPFNVRVGRGRPWGAWEIGRVTRSTRRPFE